MMRSFLGLAAASSLLACGVARPALGQETHDKADNPTAYTALRLVGKTLGADAINRVVELSGRDGKPQPTVWKIVLKEGEGNKEIEVVNGRIEAQRPLSRPVPGAPIKLPDLNLDSSGAFEATDAQARKVHVRFDSINYTLRTSDKTGKPLWSLDLFNESGGAAGTIRIAANTGAIASIDGRLATEPAPAPAKPVAASAPAPKPTTAASPRTEVRATPTPKPATTVVTADRPAPHREVASPPVTTATSTVTSVQTAPVQTTTVVDIPDAGAPPSLPPPQESGGFFTRTGRTLDHTSQNVNHSLDHASQEVTQSVRHASSTIQRFFTGRGDHDNDTRPASPPPAVQGD